MKKWTVIGISMGIILIAMFGFRVMPWSKCMLAEYDLKRPTSFSWLTGKCMVTRINGERIYLDQMREAQ